MHLIFLLMCAKFEGYYIWLRVCVLWQFFASVWKEEKTKKMSNFLEACISEMANTIYLKFGL